MKVSRQMPLALLDLGLEGLDSKILTVTIERIGDGDPSDHPHHTHDVEESFRYKKPEILRNIARAERERRIIPLHMLSMLYVVLERRKDQIDWN
jgi:hypothetical protein